MVVPTRNRLTLLQRTLASVLAQGPGVDVEVVVVDEASSDGSARWLATLGDERVRVVTHERPKGVARARNAGLAAVRSPWVAFVDDDDRWAPGKLSAQLDALDATPGAAWSVGGAVSVDERGRVLRHDDAPPSGPLAAELLASNRIPGGASGVLAATELVRDVGGFDPAFSIVADWDLWIRLALRSPLASVHRPLVAYLVHGAAMSLDPAGYRAERRLLADKHRAPAAAHGVEVDEQRAELWVAALGERAGHRLGPAGIYLRYAVRDRSRSLLRDAALALVAPRAVSRRRDAAKAAGLPPAWSAELARWL